MKQFPTEDPSKMRRRSPWLRGLLSISGLLVVGAIAAACGSSTASPGGTSAGGSATTTTGASSSTSAALVSTTNNAKLGTILVNSKGFTLYTLAGNAACDAACSAVWPPLLVSGSGSPNLGSGMAGLGTVAGTGGQQVTYNGMKLYTFTADTSPGQATGQGLTDQWGLWSAVVTKASTTPATSAPATSAPSGGNTTTTAGGGSGGVGF
jgi:predicted lipoprotein with Yx(FWY)xxD motif